MLELYSGCEVSFYCSGYISYLVGYHHCYAIS